MEELAKNGFDHVKLDGHGAQLSGVVREEDVHQFFDGFKVDKVSNGTSVTLGASLIYSLRNVPPIVLALPYNEPAHI